MAKTIEQIQQDKEILKEEIESAIKKFRDYNPDVVLIIETSRQSQHFAAGTLIQYIVDVKVEI